MVLFSVYAILYAAILGRTGRAVNYTVLGPQTIVAYGDFLAAQPSENS